MDSDSSAEMIFQHGQRRRAMVQGRLASFNNIGGPGAAWANFRTILWRNTQHTVLNVTYKYVYGKGGTNGYDDTSTTMALVVSSKNKTNSRATQPGNMDRFH